MKPDNEWTSEDICVEERELAAMEKVRRGYVHKAERLRNEISSRGVRLGRIYRIRKNATLYSRRLRRLASLGVG